MSSEDSPETRLHHILDHIDGIIAATEGLTRPEIMSNFFLRLALERSVEIVSEAAKALPPELRQREPDVPWKDMIGIGNFIRHEYFRLREDVLFNVLNVGLPALRPAAASLLALLEEKP